MTTAARSEADFCGHGHYLDIKRTPFIGLCDPSVWVLIMFTSWRLELRARFYYWTARSTAEETLCHEDFTAHHRSNGEVGEYCSLSSENSLNFQSNYPSERSCQSSLPQARSLLPCSSTNHHQIWRLCFVQVSKFADVSGLDANSDNEYCYEHLRDNTQHHLRRCIVLEVGIRDEDR